MNGSPLTCPFPFRKRGLWLFKQNPKASNSFWFWAAAAQRQPFEQRRQVVARGWKQHPAGKLCEARGLRCKRKKHTQHHTANHSKAYIETPGCGFCCGCPSFSDFWPEIGSQGFLLNALMLLRFQNKPFRTQVPRHFNRLTCRVMSRDGSQTPILDRFALNYCGFQNAEDVRSKDISEVVVEEERKKLRQAKLDTGCLQLPGEERIWRMWSEWGEGVVLCDLSLTWSRETEQCLHHLESTDLRCKSPN